MKALNLKLAALAASVALFCALWPASPAAAKEDISKVLDTAIHGTGQTRYVAIDDLGERDEAADQAIPALIKMLKDGDRQVRWRAARSLGDYGKQAQAAAPELRAMLAEKDPPIQYHAAASLGKIGDRSDATIDALVAVVTNSDSRVARAAIAALRNLKPDPQRAMAALEAVLSSDDPGVTMYALEAAVERGADAVPMLNEALKRPKTAYLACAAIEQIGPPAAATTPGLIEVLKTAKHSQLLIRALLAVARIGPEAKAASPAIIPLLETSTDATVPVAAAYALGSIGATDADAALRAAESKPNEFLQMVAAWALAVNHPGDAQAKQHALDKLHAGLKSDNPAIKAAAEKGLKMLEAAEQSAAPK